MDRSQRLANNNGDVLFRKWLNHQRWGFDKWVIHNDICIYVYEFVQRWYNFMVSHWKRTHMLLKPPESWVNPIFSLQPQKLRSICGKIPKTLPGGSEHGLVRRQGGHEGVGFWAQEGGDSENDLRHLTISGGFTGAKVPSSWMRNQKLHQHDVFETRVLHIYSYVYCILK